MELRRRRDGGARTPPRALGHPRAPRSPRQPLVAGTTASPLAKSPFERRAEVKGPLWKPRPSREARPAGAGKLCPGESLKSIFSARHPSPLRLRGGRAEGVWGESPAPAGVCVVWVWGPRARAPSAFARPAAPAPLAPPGVARQHGPGRGAAEDRQKAGEDGGQEEHGEAAEFGPQPPPPGGAARASHESRGRVLAGRPVGACGTPGPERGAAGTGRSAPWGQLRTPGWACAWPRARGRIVRAPRTRLVAHAPLDKWGSGALGGLCRARESERRDRDLEKDFRSPGTQGVCKVRGVAATAGRRRRGNGGEGGGLQNPGWPEKGQRNLS